jgi:hypothetical protein
MKTIAFRDVAGGTIHGFFKPEQKRIDRYTEALKDLEHTAQIKVYLINGNKTRFLFYRSW